MTQEVRTRVFEPFFTTKDVGKGSGLGLAQVYGFATQSGGTVRIDSEVGSGTTISLYLPKAGHAPSHDARRLVDFHRSKGRAHKEGRILLVEDDDEVAALVSEMLDQLGYHVTRAASAAAALGALSDGRSVDIVFSDVMMPGGMNGVELAREIQRRRSDMPILLTSGFSGAAIHEAKEAGVQILSKPYRIEELALALDAVKS
jgi:CheY-like chemotaxis protein